jgi:hypothetical protein
MRYFIVLLTLALSCVKTSNIQSVQIMPDDIIYKELILIDSISFINPVINFCQERNDHVLMLDANLEKIFKIDLNNFQTLETINLPQKINFLNGLQFDGIYIYLYSENSLFRFDKLRGEMVPLINPQDRIRIADLTVTRQGEIFISDDLNNQIVEINTLGKILVFNLSLQRLLIPSGIFFDDSTNRLWIINRAQQEIEIYLKNGNLDRIIKLPGPQFDRIRAARQNIFIFDKRNSTMSRIGGQSRIEYLIPGRKNILNFSVRDNSILVLKSNGLYLFQTDKQ